MLAPTFTLVDANVYDGARALAETGQVRVLSPPFPMNKAYVAALADPSLRGKVRHEIDKALEPNIGAIWAEVEKIGRRHRLAT